MTGRDAISAALGARFSEEVAAVATDGATAHLAMARRGSVRRFRPEPPPDEMVEMLAGIAMSAPSKSDLQQRDIVVVAAKDRRARLAALCAGQDWIAEAPLILVFCGNHRRQRRLHEMRGHPFANDHLDAPFNAAVDAAVALSAFVTAAEAAGLGCCPISAVRNEAVSVSDLLGLPDMVFPVAGLALGWPAAAAEVSMRLPLSATMHREAFEDSGEAEAVAAYDAARASRQPYTRQRATDRFGAAETYSWSEDKARQYASPERAGFGAFLRAKGFSLA